MEPKRRRVEPFFVGLASATYSSEIIDQFERGQGVMSPGQLESLGQRLGWGIGYHVEEEIKARVAGGEKSGRVVLCVTHLGSIGNGNSVVEVV